MKTALALSSMATALFSGTSSALATTTTPNLELKYFGARGAAEPARILLALADAKYTDTRFEIEPGTMKAPDFLVAKESGELVMNLDRAPLLLVDGTSLGQSKAIERYLAKQLGFMGQSDLEYAQIDCIVEHCRDVKDAQRRKGFSAFHRDKTDEEKATARREWFDTDLPAWLEKIEKAVQLTSGKDGYAFGMENSYVDVAIFSLLKDCGDTDMEDTLKAAETCSLLLAIVERVATDANVSKWVETRPKSMF